VYGGGVARDAAGAMLSIGALARATGLSIETLRTWERRYGFPVPLRKPSGHRVYPTTSVPRLRRIAAALAQGHRAGEVVGASDEDLAALLGVVSPAPRDAGAPAAPLRTDELLALVARFDGDALTHALNAEWGRLGPLAFLEQRVAPLVHAVGEAWQTGRLEVRHEHFLAERVGDLLRAYRLPFEDRAHGPLVVLATLPGERHAIGLQMAALTVAVAGCRVCYVGAEVPIAELGSVARDLDARAVGISVSTATRGPASAAGLRRVRRLLPARIALWIGGDGAPRRVRGAVVMRTLSALSARATALGA
jgi:MerR family transcriptional regulator, light-induced transcriptional regulator